MFVSVRPITWPWAFVLAVGAGFLLRSAFPAPALWIAAPVGIALWLLVLRGRGFWAGFAVSLLASGAFWFSLIQWLTLYLGPLPWAALAALMTLTMALGGAAIAFAWRWAPRLWPSRLTDFVLVPTLVASIWVARESLASSWPYGGFSWGRVAMSQTNGPFSNWFAVVGASGVSWLLVAIVTVLVQLVFVGPKFGWRPSVEPRVLAAATALVAIVALPQFPVATFGSLRVLAVQGGADASLFTSLPRGSVLRAQTEATLAFAGESVDVVVWPENGSDLNPLKYQQSAAILNALSKEFDAPLLVGAITERDGLMFNSSLLWQAPDGLVDWYDKLHPVPFAEYMPNRSFWRPFAPDLIDLIGRDYQAGSRPNVMSVAGAPSGVAICFDIAYDEQIRAMARQGAQIIYAQTNNADFGHTDESEQQLAIARMRSLETGLPLVNISTVGVSAIFDAHGNVLQQLPTWQPGGMLEELPLTVSTTPANLAGQALTVGMNAFGWLPLVLMIFLGPMRRRNVSYLSEAATPPRRGRGRSGQ